MAAQLLIEEGHEVLLHGRDRSRAEAALRAAPGALGAVHGDVASIAQTKALAERVNEAGPFDAVIHNVGIGYRENRKVLTEDGLPHVFAINTLAPYILTCLIKRPARLVYLSSGMHRGAQPNLQDLLWEHRSWNGASAYAESKLHDAMLAFAVSRYWRDVFSNALEPGWVATRMGGAGAPDDLTQAYTTQAWFAVSDDKEAHVTGKYFYHKKERAPNPTAHDDALQDQLIEACHKYSGVEFSR
jgi:NAD(P)-dependent dehydrogenase (short-subunit alcohol dehydrogenase family)